MRFIILSILLINYLLSDSIKVAVAANVSYAMDDIVKEFKKEHPKDRVDVIIGGSGNLTAQIKNAAPYDLFLSADMKYPLYLYKNKIAINKPIVYAVGRLILFSLKKRDLSDIKKILNSKKIKIIALANPKTAPYGKAAKMVLKKLGLFEKLRDKLVYGQSISQTVVYTLKVADVGFIAKSAIYSKKLSAYLSKSSYKEIDSSLYDPIKQGMVLIRGSKHLKLAKQFYNFMQGNNAKSILKRYGYSIDE